MNNKVSNKSCCENIMEATNKIEKNNLCLICEKQGIVVKNVTVKHMVLDELIQQVGDDDYFLCMSGDVILHITI